MRKTHPISKINLLEEIQDRVDEYIAVNELENQFETKLTDEGLLVTIRDSILLAPGKADIKMEYIVLADEIAQLLSLIHRGKSLSPVIQIMFQWIMPNSHLTGNSVL